MGKRVLALQHGGLNLQMRSLALADSFAASSWALPSLALAYFFSGPL